MPRILLVAAIFLVAVAMALSLAHALELPGKMRLAKTPISPFRAFTIPASLSAALQNRSAFWYCWQCLR